MDNDARTSRPSDDEPTTAAVPVGGGATRTDDATVTDPAGDDAGRAEATPTRDDTARDDTARHDTARHDTARHDAARHDTARHDATWYDDAVARGRARDEAGTPTAEFPPPAPRPGGTPVAGPDRPRGVSWPTVVLGLVAVLIGALVLAVQLVDLDLDWSVATPVVVVAAGGVLVLLGLVALVSGRSSGERD